MNVVEAEPSPTTAPRLTSPSADATVARRSRGGDFAAVALIAAIALAAGVAMGFSTRWGIGLSPDSVRYIQAARHLLDGQGLRGMTHFPPLYPVAIAGVSLLGLEPAVAARWLQVVLFALNVALVARLTSRVTGGGSRVWPCVAALLVAAGHVAVTVHHYALSEPLFLTLVLLSLGTLAGYVERGRTWLLCAAALTATLAVLTRYAGLALLPVLLAGVLVLSPHPTWRRRLRDAVLLALVVAVPLGLWMLRNQSVGNLTNRSLAFHPIGAVHLEGAASTISQWVFPRMFPPTVRCVLLGLLIGAAATAAARPRRHETGTDASRPPPRRLDAMRAAPLRSILWLFLVAYLALLVLSISFVDFYTPLDDRILAPAYVAALVLALDGCRRFLASATTPPRFRRAAVAAIVMLVALQAARGVELIALGYDNGIGYARRSWQKSKLLARVRKLPPDTVIYSNAADVIEMLTDRNAVGLPSRYDPTTGLPNPTYPAQRQEIRTKLVASRGVLVYFRRMNRPHHPPERELRDKLTLRVTFEAEEGAMYKTMARTAATRPAAPR